ncbi:hypothetical protein BC829DRAFT_444085 [Chytridium lagenaria]|nr:hypothetical protein BC829DRAFT_444085 [Chytridium lagenaria]
MLGYANLGDLASVEALASAFDKQGDAHVEILKANPESSAILAKVEEQSWKEGRALAYHRTLEFLINACSPASVRKLASGIVPKLPASELSTVPVAFFESMVTKHGIVPSERALHPLITFLCNEGLDSDIKIREQLAQGLTILMRERKLKRSNDVLQHLVKAFGKDSEVAKLYSTLLA